MFLSACVLFKTAGFGLWLKKHESFYDASEVPFYVLLSKWLIKINMTATGSYGFIR